MSSQTQNFKVGPCSISFKGELLGITNNTSTLSFNFGYYDVKCNRTHDQVLEKRLTGIEILFRTEILQVDKAIDHILNEDKTLTLDELGKRMSHEGGELLIVPLSTHDKTAYRLPNAIIVNRGELNLSNSDEYTLGLEFEANYHDGEEILIQSMNADACQRESLQRDSISPISLERALNAYIADKIDLIVDTNIFRGNLPLGVDGSAVIMHKREAVEYGMSQCYRFTFISMDKSRDVVMGIIHKLRDSLPVYGDELALDDGNNITIKALLSGEEDLDHYEADNGKIKTRAILDLSLTI